MPPGNPVGRKLQTLKWNWMDGCFQGAQPSTRLLGTCCWGSWLHSFQSCWCFPRLHFSHPLKIGILEGKCNNPHHWSQILRGFCYTGNLKRKTEKFMGGRGERQTRKDLSFLFSNNKGRCVCGVGEREREDFYFNTLVYNGIWIISSFSAIYSDVKELSE